uniref:Uncharacterized protein n=1 Tax=Rhizophora mucronata TaxID=61149 RepID=A0A2P2PX90_RHIMU
MLNKHQNSEIKTTEKAPIEQNNSSISNKD